MTHAQLAAIALLGLASAIPANASTPQAWNQMNTRVNRECVAMSGLSRPELLAAKISFSDTIGTEIRMIRGTDRKGVTHRKLCAYNRKTGRTEVQDAAGWNGPAIKP
jgi:hypothetical protein